MKTENEILSVINEETAKHQPARAKVAHVDGATATSGEIKRVKSPLTVAIDNATENAMNAAAAAAWKAGKHEILRSAIELINSGHITRTAAAAAWKGTDGLRKHISSAKEEGAIDIPGVRRYFVVGTHDSIFDALKNMGNIARAYCVRYYTDGNAREKEAEIQAKLNAAAAATAREAKRLQLIEEMNAAAAAGDFKRAFNLSQEIAAL